DPSDRICEPEAVEKAEYVGVAVEDDVVVAIPGDVSDSQRRGQAAQVVGPFDQGDPLAAVGQPEREGHAHHAATHDPPALVHEAFSIRSRSSMSASRMACDTLVPSPYSATRSGRLPAVMKRVAWS